MKKAKIMLLVLAIVAIAGGTLAFNTKFQSKVCFVSLSEELTTCTAEVGFVTCNDEAENTDVATDVHNICYSVIPEDEDCVERDCPIPGRLIDEPGN